MSFDSYTNYGGTPPHQAHSRTSREAALAIKDEVNDLQYRVYLVLVDAGKRGLIDEELIEHFSRHGGQEEANKIRPRRIELRDLGFVKDSGRERKTSKNRPATVWVAVHPDEAPAIREELLRRKATACPKCGQPKPPSKSVLRKAFADISALLTYARSAKKHIKALEKKIAIEDVARVRARTEYEDMKLLPNREEAKRFGAWMRAVIEKVKE